MRLRFKGKGAKNKEFVNISLDTAQEIKQVIKHLKVKQVIEARQFIETKYKDQPPYRRWLDQAKEAAAAEPSLTVYGVLSNATVKRTTSFIKAIFKRRMMTTTPSFTGGVVQETNAPDERLAMGSL